jgi:hypothetical protein
MTKTLSCVTAILLGCIAQFSYAGDQTPAADGDSTQTRKIEMNGAKEHHPWTLEDARRHAHEYADRLDKMTPEEWNAMLEKRKERMKQWEARMEQHGVHGKPSAVRREKE